MTWRGGTTGSTTAAAEALSVGAVAPPRSGVRQDTGFAGVRIQAAAPSTQDLRSHPGQTIRVLGPVRGGRSDHICVTPEILAHIRPGQRLTALIALALACRPIMRTSALITSSDVLSFQDQFAVTVP